MSVATSSACAVDRPESKRAKTLERSYPGAVVAVEGVDGSGKSTQLDLLRRWLEIEGCFAHFAEWHPSPLVDSAIRRDQSSRWLTPATFSVIYAADFADRYEQQILPLLRDGHIVLTDGYIYAALARDGARGCSMRALRNLYRFAVAPDITFYLRVPLDLAVQRVLGGGRKLKYYEAGMDLGLSLNRAESFRIFQGMIIERYEQLAQTDDFLVMDGTLPVQQLQQQMRQIVSSQIDLKRFKADELGTVLAQSKSQIRQDAREKREIVVANEVAIEPVRTSETPKFPAGDGFSAHAQRINDLVARRAYELFASRGFAHGHEREDWRRAESEIVLDVPVDITETEMELIIRAEVPGFSENDLEVRAAPHSLCITGERPEAAAPTQGRIVYSERRAAHVFRALDLPSEIDPERSSITLGNGILQIKLSKARVAEKVHVLVKAAAA